MDGLPEKLPAVATKRGTKQTCANEECGRRFYDLNKLPTNCPYCGVKFTAPAKVEIDPKAYVGRSKAKTYKIVQQDPVESEEVEAEADVELEDETSAGPAAEDIPENEDEEIDEKLSPARSERDDQ